LKNKAMSRFTRGPWGILAALVVAVLTTCPSAAVELLVFQQPGCPHCAAFDREIWPTYESTTRAIAVRARRFDLSKPIPADITFVKVERMVPNFVLVDGRREIGRFRGYANPDQFWRLFAELVERLERDISAGSAVDKRSGEPASAGAAAPNNKR
jgi:hypothetical protein